MNRVSSTMAAALLILALPQVAHPRLFPPGPSSVTQHKAPPQEELRIFTGTIVSVNEGAFSLKEEKTGLLCGLDNQALAHQFAGKMVTVTGTLNKAAMIHVENIEEQKA